MRDYQQVINERYEKENLSVPESNIYAPINPIGQYIMIKEIKLLTFFLKKLAVERNKHLNECKILDCGCGGGTVSRIVAELVGSSENIYGFELSKNRLEKCKKMNGTIHYRYGDVVKAFPFSEIKFDAAMAVFVLSHIRTREDLCSALENIYSSLDAGGLFMWLEINAKTHYANFDADTQGFSHKEMDELAKRSGFELCAHKGIGKLISIPMTNSRINTLYMPGKMPIPLVEFVSLLGPFPCAYSARIYYKV
ncbi:MAG: class I SAM-dependent methyltransferase [Lachnospiraceae bacterium]|nr:class I SAM-dependent methyltransferase [Lachnospiraceae bacterium]